MNTAGIIGGIISTSLVPVLVRHFGWLTALSSGAAMAIACTLAWWLMKDSVVSASGHMADLTTSAPHV
jgi:cyanate permease